MADWLGVNPLWFTEIWFAKKFAKIEKLLSIVLQSPNLILFNHHSFIVIFFPDPRTRDWFLISSPVPGASIIIGYLYFVLSWGPKHMKHRKPYQLNNVLVLYNFLQVLLSTWLFWEGLDGAWLNNYNWKCEPVDFSYSPHALRVRKYCISLNHLAQ